jgi:hypothetical protein
VSTADVPVVCSSLTNEWATPRAFYRVRTAAFRIIDAVPACLRYNPWAQRPNNTRAGRKPKTWLTCRYRTPAFRPMERPMGEVDLLIKANPPAEGTLRRRLWERRQREQEAA